MERRWQLLGAAAVALAIYGVMDASIRDTEPWHEEGAGEAGDLDALVTAVFDRHVIALEVLGILLTAAMIGALVIARPLGAAPDESHYPKPTSDELSATQHTSDVEVRK